MTFPVIYLETFTQYALLFCHFAEVTPEFPHCGRIKDISILLNFQSYLYANTKNSI